MTSANAPTDRSCSEASPMIRSRRIDQSDGPNGALGAVLPFPVTSAGSVTLNNVANDVSALTVNSGGNPIVSVSR